MTTTTAPILRRLETADIPAAMRLKEAAGWNQTEQDWANVLAIEPEGCFAIECDGTVQATATTICYGRELAWIGMVLTAPGYRGRGFARRLMQRCIDFAESREVDWIKLDATDMGRPLYASLGFEDECFVERWLLDGKNNTRTACGEEFEPGPCDLILDRAAFGADRSAILSKVAVESASIPGCGYAMGRPGTKAAYFGPCVTRSAEAGRRLLEWFLARHAGESVFWDLLSGNEDALRLAREYGFELRRRLTRMALRGSPAARPFTHDDSAIFAIAGFECG